MMLPAFAVVCVLLLAAALAAPAWWISGLLLCPPRRPLTRTPAECGLAYEDILVRSRDGLVLKGWWIPAPGASQPGHLPATVILLHPMFANRHGFRPQPGVWPRGLRANVDLLKTAQVFSRAGYGVLMFDFRGHGESQSGMCGGGLTEDQDVLAAVDYVFERLTTDTPETPRVGVVGFGLGATAAIAAAGREKGGAEAVRVFSGDSEGGFGWAVIPPANVKRLRFLIAIQPASLGVLVKRYLRARHGALGAAWSPLVDRMCQWRGGYPLGPERLLRYAREVHVPTLYLQARSDPWSDTSELQKLCELTPGCKQLAWIDAPPGRLEAYDYLGDHPEGMLAFAAEQVGAG